MDNVLRDIFEGWKNFAIQNPRIEKISKRRMDICSKCKHLTPKGKCKKCGCFMFAKTRAPKARCPIGYW